MTLDSWRTAKGLNFAELGSLLQSNKSRAYRLCRGHLPDRQEMAIIDAVTGGQVTANDFYADMPADSTAAAEEAPANA